MNQVIEQAILAWDLPERVKRLAIPSYRYSKLDMQHMQLLVAQDQDKRILGVMAWEKADPTETPQAQAGLLLHGIYIEPTQSRKGIGSRLLQALEAEGRKSGVAGILVKAQADAVGFFLTMGYTLLPVNEANRDYHNRYWKSLK